MMFINPAVLLLLIGLPFAIVFFVWRERLRTATLERLGNLRLLLPDSTSISAEYRKWKFILWTVAVIALIIALARPVWGEDVSLIETQGVSVMVILDVSKSMDAQDVTPSRLGRAKLGILDLLKGLAGNEVGLILFAGSAFVQFPLTTDTVSAATFLEAATTQSISRQGTNLEAAIRLGIDSFNDAFSSHRLIILMTDGENHEGNITHIANEAAGRGITIYTVGYGSADGAPIPVRDASGSEIGFLTDEAGDQVTSRLDEGVLRTISERTEGKYLRGSSTGEEIRTLIQDISAIESEQLGSRTESQGVERFGIFVALAALALTLEILLPEARREVAG